MAKSDDNLSGFPEENPNPVIRIYRDGRVLYRNPAAARHSGWTCEVGKVHPNRDLLRLVGKAMKTGKAFEREIGLDGVPFAVAVAPVAAEGYANLYARDITERKKAERALHRANQRLEAAVARRTSELSNAVDSLQQEVRLRTEVERELRQRSEQLRELASELTLAEQRERRRLAEVLHDNLQQLLVGAKLRLSMLERSGDGAVRATTEAVEELLDESIRCSRSLTAELSPPILHQGGLVPALEWLAAWMRRKHALKVELAVNPRAEPPTEEIKVLLFQSARELLFNAVKHAGVLESRMRLGASGDELVLEVSDDGSGFDPASVMPRQGRAGGFGLFSIHERLDLLGGRLEIESRPGGGSRFRMFAPVGRKEPDAGVRPEIYEDISITGLTALAEAAVSVAEDEALARATIRVLLVDDHMVVRQGLSSLIREEEDMEIVGEASDGLMAVEMVRRVEPDVVLMDISMPRMGGIEATRVIRAEHPEVRVIGLSMFEKAEAALKMREAGACDYLTKSGPSESLLAAIRKCGRRERTT